MVETIHRDNQPPSLVPRNLTLRLENQGRIISPQNPDPPTIPFIDSTVVSSVPQDLPLGGSNPGTPATLDNPHLPGGNGGVDPNPGAVNTQAPSPANSLANSDPTLPSIGILQIQKAEDGGPTIGTETLRSGFQTAQDGTTVSVGIDRVTKGDSTIPLAAPTEVVPGSNPIVMPAPDPVLVGGNTVDRLPDGGVLIAGSTSSSGNHTTISRVDTSFAGNGVVVDCAAHMLPPRKILTPVLISGQTIGKAANGGVVIAGSKYLPGVQATASGTVLSVGTGKTT